MNNHSVQNLLANNVVELTFVRRHEKLGWNNVRGIIGTTNYALLNSEFGFQVLHFKPPIGVGMGYNYKSKNLCVIWDFFRQEYRVFGAEQVTLRKLFDVNDPEKEEEFYDWFYDHIISMSEQQKLDFMGYEGEAYASQQLARRQQRQKTTQQVERPTLSVPKRILNIYNNVKNYMMNFLKKKKG